MRFEIKSVDDIDTATDAIANDEVKYKNDLLDLNVGDWAVLSYPRPGDTSYLVMAKVTRKTGKLLVAGNVNFSRKFGTGTVNKSMRLLPPTRATVKAFQKQQIGVLGKKLPDRSRPRPAQEYDGSHHEVEQDRTAEAEADAAFKAASYLAGQPADVLMVLISRKELLDVANYIEHKGL